MYRGGFGIDQQVNRVIAGKQPSPNDGQMGSTAGLRAIFGGLHAEPL